MPGLKMAEFSPTPLKIAYLLTLVKENYIFGLWGLTMRGRFVESAPGGRYIPVAHSSHLMVWEQPQAVIEAIKDMVELVKK
jgi:hypothetical protein